MKRIENMTKKELIEFIEGKQAEIIDRMDGE